MYRCYSYYTAYYNKIKNHLLKKLISVDGSVGLGVDGIDSQIALAVVF